MKFIKESRLSAPPSTVFAFHESPGRARASLSPGRTGSGGRRRTVTPARLTRRAPDGPGTDPRHLGRRACGVRTTPPFLRSAGLRPVRVLVPPSSLSGRWPGRHDPPRRGRVQTPSRPSGTPARRLALETQTKAHVRLSSRTNAPDRGIRRLPLLALDSRGHRPSPPRRVFHQRAPGQPRIAPYNDCMQLGRHTNRGGGGLRGISLTL